MTLFSLVNVWWGEIEDWDLLVRAATGCNSATGKCAPSLYMQIFKVPVYLQGLIVVTILLCSGISVRRRPKLYANSPFVLPCQCSSNSSCPVLFSKRWYWEEEVRHEERSKIQQCKREVGRKKRKHSHGALFDMMQYCNIRIMPIPRYLVLKVIHLRRERDQSLETFCTVATCALKSCPKYHNGIMVVTFAWGGFSRT